MGLTRLLIISIGMFLTISIFGIAFAHDWMAPEGEATKNNPIPISSESITTGNRIYTNHCSYCHGENSAGRKKEDTGLSQDTPNLVRRIKNHTDGDFHWKILNGKGGMPSFKGKLSDAEIWHVINYIKSLDQ